MASSRPVIERSHSSTGVQPVPSPRHGALPLRVPTTTTHAPERAPKHAPDGWSLDSLVGRFLEITGAHESASLTAAASLILETQLRGEPAAWVCVGDSTFYPPDFAACGIDLATLPVIRMSDATSAARAAEHLLRSDGFGAITLDLDSHHNITFAAQARLAALARKYRAIVACLTRKDPSLPSLGPMVSLRARGRAQKSGFDRFSWEIDVVKDRRLGTGWRHTEVRSGPDGLC
jgi:recombination protein RecA